MRRPGALGRTNREIAQDICLSTRTVDTRTVDTRTVDTRTVDTRTVDMHVRNGLAKLDCRSRAEAVHTATAAGMLV
jgi:DNA-binding CsgD family transcriptional regulator